MKTQFVTDNHGKKLAVILPIKEYNKMLDELEELEDIKLYDEAKKTNEPSIPIDDAFKMIEAKRNAK
jgi:PHD/YefM family antitoxin component YafN of YafNO toxin-antitoxin module